MITNHLSSHLPDSSHNITCTFSILSFLMDKKCYSGRFKNVHAENYKIALKRSSKNSPKMDLVVNELYYRILDRSTELHLITFNTIRAIIEDNVLILTNLRGFTGVFPVFEDPMEYEYLNSPAITPDSGHDDELNLRSLPPADRRCLANYVDRIFTFVFLAQGEVEFLNPCVLLRNIALLLGVTANEVDLWLPL